MKRPAKWTKSPAKRTKSPVKKRRAPDAKLYTQAYICARGGKICQVAIDAKLFCQIVGGYFFLFCQNYMDAKLR